MKACLLAFGLVSGIAHAARPVPPPRWPLPHIQPGPLAAQPVTGLTIGGFGIKFDQTTFDDVASHLGIAPIGQRGGAGEFEKWVCYSLPATHGRLWLISSELDGQERIDGFVVRQEPESVVVEPMCPAVAATSPAVMIDPGVAIGSSAGFVDAALGKFREAPESVVYYAYQGQVGGYNVSSILALRIRQGTVTEMHATHIAMD